MYTWSDGSEFKGGFNEGKITGYGVYRFPKTGKLIEGSNWSED